MGWIKDAIAAAKTIRAIRKQGETCHLALVDEEELIDNRNWLAVRDYENKLMQECILGFHNHIPPCNYCEEAARKTCNKASRPERGCEDWWLRFLTDDEIKLCQDRAKEGTK